MILWQSGDLLQLFKECEAAIHAMSQTFNEDDSEAVPVVDASSGFIAVNRKLFLQTSA